jgi:hypothetical protein
MAPSGSCQFLRILADNANLEMALSTRFMKVLQAELSLWNLDESESNS